jgi:carbon-monoxide dehydrogenase large subunit
MPPESTDFLREDSFDFRRARSIGEVVRWSLSMPWWEWALAPLTPRESMSIDLDTKNALPTPQIGRPLPRREDIEMVKGGAKYLDDIDLPDMVHVTFVRSPLAHARIKSIGKAEALRAPGVVSIVTAETLDGRVRALPVGRVEDAAFLADAAQPLLAHDRVRYVGEPVAAVVAETRALAKDATELVAVEYEPLPVVADVRGALGSPHQIHDHVPDNTLLRVVKSGGDVSQAFADADRTVAAKFHIPRLVAAPIETRGAVSWSDSGNRTLTVWCSAQDTYRPLADLSHVLDRRAETIRLIVPAVGGAFGSKGGIAAEAAVTAWLALELGRPIKWSEDRRENFLAAYQGRGLDAEVEFAVAADGKILGLRARLFADCGAYLQQDTADTPLITAKLLTGVYAIPSAEVEVVGVATNRVPTGPYRGAGRPEAAFILERMVDMVARDLALDPVEVRRRNFIPSGAFPYRSPLGILSDPGDYRRCLDLLIERLEVDHWREVGRRDQRLIGVGVAMLLENCGGHFESVAAAIDKEGRLILRISPSPHGQGHETIFAQIAAEYFGMEPEDVDVRYGDSAIVPPGTGTFGSRSVSIAGSAAVIAVQQLRDKCRAVAARQLDLPPETLVWQNRGFAAGASGRTLSLREVALAAAEADDLPAELRIPLTAEASFRADLLFSTGAYGCVLEIDEQTGRLTMLKVVAVDDAGRIVNPLLAEGQVVGATAQGLGEALLEEALVDEDGQPATVNFADYTMPSAADMPHVESVLVQTLSSLTPLGARGIGEAGTIGAPAAVGNALADALARFGVRHIDLPFTSEKIWRLINTNAAVTASDP